MLGPALTIVGPGQIGKIAALISSGLDGTIDLAAANDSTGQVEHAGHLVNLARLNSGRGSRTIISGCHIRTGRRLRRIVRAAGHLPRATAPSSHGIEAPPNHIHGRAYRRCHLHQRRARLLRRHGADRQ